MIKSIEVKNFQSHKHSKLEFDPGINVIVGRGQSGKTAILRALLLLVKNRPSGYRFHTHGEKNPTEVEVVFQAGEEERSIALVKAKNKSSYIIDHEQVLSGFGRSVPQEVEQIVNLSDTNIHGQLDKPFLITDTPGEVGKVISRITKLEQVDVWISKLTKRINESNYSVKLWKSELERDHEEVKEYDFLPELERELSKLEVMKEEWTSLRLQVANLFTLIDSCKKIEEKKSSISYSPEAMDILDKTKKDIGELILIDRSIANLKEYIRDQLDIAEEIRRTKKAIIGREDEYASMLKELGCCPFCHQKLTAEVIGKLIDEG